MTCKDLQIEMLTAALRDCGDGICDYCVGCQALGRDSHDGEGCIDLDGDDRAKFFVFDFNVKSSEFGR